MTLAIAAGTPRPPLGVSASPSPVTAFGNNATITTGGCSVTVTNGVPPYSYSWAYSFGDAISVDSPAAVSTTFTATGLAPLEPRVTSFQVNVTDAVLNTGSTTVQVRITRN